MLTDGKTAAKKFIISAMLAVTILLVVLIGGINVFNYLTTSGDNDRLMEMLCYSFETSTKWSADTTDNTQPPQSINGTQQNTTADISGSQNNPVFRRKTMELNRPTIKRTTALADTIKTQWILHAMPPLRSTKTAIS